MMNDLGPKRTVLIVDDEPGMRTALYANFQREGWITETACGVGDARRAAERKTFDLVVTDVRMMDGNGFDVLDHVRKQSPDTCVILLTAFGSVPEAVRSMRDGAFDYLTKPVTFEQLQNAANRILTQKAGSSVSKKQQACISDKPIGNAKLVGRSPVLLESVRRAQAAASTDSDVLIEAESGTGKEVIARFIHEASVRRTKPFLAINCAAVPDTLLETELFGHAKGAFTGAATAKPGKFELANGGTLLLDEIGDMPLGLQPKLLRVLQEREFERVGDSRAVRVDIRIIATTNASLSSMVQQGRFRGDLYYRLNVIPLSIPPLRDRGDDIALLAQYFANRIASEVGRRPPRLEDSFFSSLQTYRWPGNVRELSNFMRRVLSLHGGDVLDAAAFRDEIRPLGTGPSLPGDSLVPGTPMSVLERLHVEKTLAMANGNRTRAAEMLGISLRTMRNKIKEYGLPPRRYA